MLEIFMWTYFQNITMCSLYGVFSKELFDHFNLRMCFIKI